MEQEGELMPAARSPLDAWAALEQDIYRLDFNETSKETGLVKIPVSPNFPPSLKRQGLCSSKGSRSKASWWGSWPEKTEVPGHSGLWTLLTCSDVGGGVGPSAHFGVRRNGALRVNSTK